MFDFLTISAGLITIPLWAMPVWYALPLVVAISLVHAATRHELMRPILVNAARFGTCIVIFMLVLYAVLRLMSWAQ
jgi:hypothetical protein